MLGPLVVSGPDGSPVDVAGARLRALLTLLALDAGRAVTPGALAAELWPNPDIGAPANPGNAVQALVSRLRGLLGREAIASGPSGYVLDLPREEVDALLFEARVREARGGAGRAGGAASSAAGGFGAGPELTARLLGEALALWRGPALADTPELAPGRAARLESLRRDALDELAEARLALAAPGAGAGVGVGVGVGAGAGAGAGAADDPGLVDAAALGALVAELRERVAAEPLRDLPRAQLIRALAAAGRTGEALSAFDEARRVFADRLGAGPSPALRAAHALALREPAAGPGVGGHPRAEHHHASRPVADAPASGAADSGPPDSRAPAARRAEAAAPARPARPASAEPGVLPAPERVRTLPASLTSFVGRAEELERTVAALADDRLVTLLGPGGAGKTRLALETAAALAAGPAAGPAAVPSSPGPPVRLVELAPVSDPGDVAGTVLAALRLREPTATVQRPGARPQPPAEAVSRIADAIGARELLLVLDNCEHLIEAAAALTGRLLAACPHLRVLATSREPLGITGERLLPVPPLAFPDPGQDLSGLTPEQARARYPALRLFAERGAAARPGFALTEQNLPAVAEICRALDGHPLALELAAARLRALTPAQLAERLDARFRLLTSGDRTALPRHRTLRAVVDWSWELLEKPERVLLAQLSVFAGTASLEAVEEVCDLGDPDADVFDALASLVDKSLVVPLPDGRYRLLETIRAYAADRLAEDEAASGAGTAVRDAHVAHYLRFVERAEPLLRTREQVTWLRRYREEHDNLLTALRWCVARRDSASAVRLVAGIGWYLWLRGERGDHITLLHEAVDLPPAEPEPTPGERQAAVLALAFTALYEMDSTWNPETTLRLIERAIDLRAGLPAGTAAAHPLLPLLDVVHALFLQHDVEIGPLARPLFDAPDPWLRATARLFAGFAQQNAGRAAEGEALTLDAHRHFAELGELWGMSFCAAGLAEYAQWRGDLDGSLARWEEALSYEERLGLDGEVSNSRSRMAGVQALRSIGDPRALADLEERCRQEELHGNWSAQMTLQLALSTHYRLTGRAEDARALIRRALDRLPSAVAAVPQARAMILGMLGRAEAACGELESAEALHREAVGQALAAADGPVIGETLEGWSLLALRQGRPESAAELLGAAVTYRGTADLSSPDVRQATARVREVLGEAAFAEAHARGRAVPRGELPAGAA